MKREEKNIPILRVAYFKRNFMSNLIFTLSIKLEHVSTALSKESNASLKPLKSKHTVKNKIRAAKMSVLVELSVTAIVLKDVGIRKT